MLNKKCLFTHFTFFRNSSFLLNSISFTTVTNKEKRKTKEGNGIDQEEKRCKKTRKTKHVSYLSDVVNYICIQEIINSTNFIVLFVCSKHI